MERPAVPVGLENHVNPVEMALARRGQGRADLRRMMAVVVDDRDAALLALELESAIDTAKAGKAVANRRRVQVQFESNCDDGRGIQHVVHTRHVHMEATEIPASELHLKLTG